jgi:trehalose 6-phosphate synthase
VESPIVLAQDYHFGIVATHGERSAARCAGGHLLAHSWPNPEVFAICPWQRELIDGLLGADLIGFHIQSHCNNFLFCVDRLSKP